MVGSMRTRWDRRTDWRTDGPGHIGPFPLRRGGSKNAIFRSCVPPLLHEMVRWIRIVNLQVQSLMMLQTPNSVSFILWKNEHTARFHTKPRATSKSWRLFIEKYLFSRHIYRTKSLWYLMTRNEKERQEMLHLKTQGMFWQQILHWRLMW